MTSYNAEVSLLTEEKILREGIEVVIRSES